MQMQMHSLDQKVLAICIKTSKPPNSRDNHICSEQIDNLLLMRPCLGLSIELEMKWLALLGKEPQPISCLVLKKLKDQQTLQLSLQSIQQIHQHSNSDIEDASSNP